MEGSHLSDPQFQKLIQSFSSLPGIGKKSATRIGFHILRMDPSTFQTWLSNIEEAKVKLRFCDECGGLTEDAVCSICLSDSRETGILCVVEQPEDIFFIENTKEYVGKYHVLNGAISPLDGIGPDQLRIRQLLKRLEDGEIKEVLIATNPTLEGDATASYLSTVIKPMEIKITRIAHGITIGGTLEYSDQYTLGKAIKSRLTL
ncbi:recombination protein RecR [Leptospira kanakyensis]|uniref:Recombination protein RecR n=1 Tax=Leptospira kanakyensis TaxID=2484968 RepID=A0A6N4QE69_9LEPT|nr:recombination mediator RecR [Leptospira kanakyensis]TGK50327.1 recombination protein RecR [Leptospira kanakyensis]TGK64071.1 recombination protein RecR [Leptospira kanakyensis]TGK69467.1 recombination protein RecR [Leptospira kanakyensis]